MNSLSGILALSFCSVLSCLAQDAESSAPAPNLPAIEVFFSGHGGCTEAVVKELGRAKATILVHTYSFTSAPIAKALLDHSAHGERRSSTLNLAPQREKKALWQR